MKFRNDIIIKIGTIYKMNWEFGDLKGLILEKSDKNHYSCKITELLNYHGGLGVGEKEDVNVSCLYINGRKPKWMKNGI